MEEARAATPRFRDLLLRAYEDLEHLVRLEGTLVPGLETVRTEVIEALVGGHLMDQGWICRGVLWITEFKPSE